MSSKVNEIFDRRSFLQRTGALITRSTLILTFSQSASADQKDNRKDEEISPPEDLMREHGVLRRILLIYENIEEHLIKGTKFPLEVLWKAAEIIRKFIEDYHERLEEDYIFPRFEEAGKLVELAKLLKKQHEAGRKLTASIHNSVSDAVLRDVANRRELAEKLHLFIRMYRPHAAREDTVLFPVLRSIMPAREY